MPASSSPDATRRQILLALSALAATPLASLAASPALAASDDLPDIVKHVQEVMLGFDLGEAVAKAAELAGIRKRHVRAWRAAVGTRLAGLGFRANDVLRDDPELTAALAAVVDTASKDRFVQLRLRRLLLDLPRDPAAVQPRVDALFTELVGLDVAGLHAHAEGLERDGLLVVYGGCQDLTELAAMMSSHLMTRFLEAVHGRRARVVHASDLRSILEGLVDPENRVVVFFGHGFWHSFSLGPYQGPPEAIWERLTRALDRDLKETVGYLAGGQLYRVFPHARGAITETELDALWKAWFPDARSADAARKDLVVRMTCASDRFSVESRLFWQLMPEDLRALSYQKPWDQEASPHHPEVAEAWDEAMEAFMAEHGAAVTEKVALGTSMVRDPADTRGYRGLTWIHHFIEDPIPPSATTPAWLRVRQDGSAEGPTEATTTDTDAR